MEESNLSHQNVPHYPSFNSWRYYPLCLTWADVVAYEIEKSKIRQLLFPRFSGEAQLIIEGTYSEGRVKQPQIKRWYCRVCDLQIKLRIRELLSKGSSRCDAGLWVIPGHWQFETGSLKIPPKPGGNFHYESRTWRPKIHILDTSAQNSSSAGLERK